jgi:membrane protein DedA with SNARE-associated domain/rhodanese-related sulfurtransferase
VFEQALDFVGRFGAPMVFLVVFIDQIGVPIPSPPMLLAFGALAGAGRIDPVLGLLAAVAGSLCADSAWFQLGRRKGSRVLGWMCRLSLEPDSCVSRTRDVVARNGARALLVAKFIPGLDTVGPPLAGMLGIGVPSFLLWSAAGALLWAATFGGLGYAFSHDIESVLQAADRLGGTLLLAAVGLLVAYIGWKLWARHRVLYSLRMARITPRELHELIVSGEPPVIIDARNRSAVAALPVIIEGALSVTLAEVEARQDEIAREREVVVYCSCPNEVSAAQVALRLKRFGIHRVRPLAGGIEAWQEQELPVVPVATAGAGAIAGVVG